MTTPRGARTAGAPGSRLLGVAFVLVAVNLRLPIAAVSPVLVQIQAALHLSAAEAGLLTAIPVVCFGAFAFVTPRLRRRAGAEYLMVLVVALLCAGTLWRVAPGVGSLYAGTALIGAAIAVGNVLLPAVIKADFAEQAAVLTGLYSMALSAGSAVSAGLTVPIERATGRGWRVAVGSWVVFALVALALWGGALVLRRTRGHAPAPVRPEHLGGLWRDRLAWAVTAFMGLQSFGFYSTLAWVPTLLEQHHMSAARAGWLLSFSSLPALASSFAMPLVARRLRARLLPLAGVLCCYAGAYLGLAFDPVGAPYFWMTLLGVAQGAALSLALGYIIHRAPDPEHAGELSMMAQGVGYLVASMGPVLFGLAHEWTRSWRVPLLFLLVLLVPLALAGALASSERHVRRVPPAVRGADSRLVP